MIEVVGYRDEWPVRFAFLRERYATALENAGVLYRSIEHVGSTAVPGLAAKPVIDVDIVVDASDITAATAALEAIGLEARGDLGVTDRYAFVTPPDLAPTNTYLVVDGSLALRNHLAVRDVLRSDAALREDYDTVKRAAAASSANIDQYLRAKSGVLERILERAGLTAEERAEIRRTTEAITVRGASG